MVFHFFHAPLVDDYRSDDVEGPVAVDNRIGSSARLVREGDGPAVHAYASATMSVFVEGRRLITAASERDSGQQTAEILRAPRQGRGRLEVGSVDPSQAWRVAQSKASTATYTA